MSGIFISYRREDASAYAGRLYDLLVAKFGRDRVFMDIDTIAPGEDFRKVIRETCSSCEVLLAVMGKSWATACDKSGKIRLENEKDFVRLEIASALTKELRVIPVLVGGAEMPEVSSLPIDIQDLAYHQAWEVSDRRFHSDAEALIEALRITLERPPSSRQLQPTAGPSVPVSGASSPSKKKNSAVASERTKLSQKPVEPPSPRTPPAPYDTQPVQPYGEASTQTPSGPEAERRKRKEALLAKQRSLTGAILNRWLEHGSRRQPDEETESLQRQSEQVKLELEALEQTYFVDHPGKRYDPKR